MVDQLCWVVDRQYFILRTPKRKRGDLETVTMYLQWDQIIVHIENDIARGFSPSRVLPNDHSIHVERIENQSRFAP